MKKGIVTATLAFAALAANLGNAAVTPSSTTSVQKTTAQKIAEKTLFQVAMAYYGPSVGDFSGSQPTAADSRGGGPQLIDTGIIAAYRVNQNLNIGPVIKLNVQPGDAPGVTFGDPYLRIQHTSLFSANGLTIGGDLRFYVPVSEFSQTQQLLTGMRATPFISYDVPTTKLNLGVFSFVRRNFFGGNLGNDYAFYVAPNAAYTFFDNFSATAWFEAIDAGYSAPNDKWAMGDINLQLGVDWLPIPQLEFQPYLKVFLSNPSVQTLGLGMNFTARLL